MVQRIIDRTESLPQHPLIGALVPEYDAERLRELLESTYRIIYRILPAQIDIIAVIHAARLMPRDLPGTADSPSTDKS
jgi:plasmid stabilization system protein ParE